MIRKVLCITTVILLGVLCRFLSTANSNATPTLDADTYASFLNASANISTGINSAALGEVGDKYSGTGTCIAGDESPVIGTVYATIILVEEAVSFNWYGGVSQTRHVNGTDTQGLDASDWYLYDSRSAWSDGSISGPGGSASDVCYSSYTLGLFNGAVSCD